MTPACVVNMDNPCAQCGTVNAAGCNNKGCPVWDVPIRPGDRVIVVETWDYGPPANPRVSYVVQDVSLDSVRLWGCRVTIPARCVRKVDHD